RDQIVLFGGRTEKPDLNDTWIYSDKDWTQVDTPNSPPVRQLAGGAFDPIRDRCVLYGGIQTSVVNSKVTLTPLDDTGELDGTTWNKIALTATATRLFGAALAYDDNRQLTTMFGGTPVVGSPLADTWVYTSAAWLVIADSTRPGPRSLFTFTTDPVNNTIL